MFLFSAEERASFDEWASVALDVVSEAKRMLQEADECANLELTSKQFKNDIVTMYDRKVEEFIMSRLSQHYPDHIFIGEENENIVRPLSDAPTWMLDPIDGTTNFVHRFPFYAISLALVYKKKVVLGIVCNCRHNETYTAVVDKGSYRNGERISVSCEKEKENMLVLTEWGCFENEHLTKIKLDAMFKLYCSQGVIRGIRSLGCASLNLCYVASGKANAYYEWGIHCWDVAAGVLIVREAGGVVSDISGTTFDIMARNIVAASNTQILDKVLQCMPKINMARDDSVCLSQENNPLTNDPAKSSVTKKPNKNNDVKNFT